MTQMAGMDAGKNQKSTDKLPPKQMELMRKMIGKADQEEAQDFELAMQLMNRYKKDKDFLKKEDKQVERQMAKYLPNEDKDGNAQSTELMTVKRAATSNPVLMQEERHR